MEISSLTGEFTNAATETDFLEHKRERTSSVLGFTLVLCSVFYLGFSATDVAALGWGPDARAILGARMLAVATAATGAWLAFRRALTVNSMRLTANLVEGVALGSFMFIAIKRPAEFHWHAMSLAIMLMGVYLYVPNRLRYALAQALLATAVFLLLAAQYSRMTPADTFTMGMLLVVLNTLGFLAARRHNHLSREEYRSYLVLKQAAERDHLTGCFNRRYLHEQLMGKRWRGSAAEPESLTVVLCDIDHFKRINDTHGHGDGDIVLCAFARILQAATRKHVDSVVRYGGEEFLMVLPGTDLEGGVALAERLRGTFGATELVATSGGDRIHVTASFGVATVGLGRKDFDDPLRQLISTADELMYQAKRKGRDRVEHLQLE